MSRSHSLTGLHLSGVCGSWALLRRVEVAATSFTNSMRILLGMRTFAYERKDPWARAVGISSTLVAEVEKRAFGHVLGFWRISKPSYERVSLSTTPPTGSLRSARNLASKSDP